MSENTTIPTAEQNERRYSALQTHRSSTDSIIEFDVHIGRQTAWESIRVSREDGTAVATCPGDITISDRGDGWISIAAEILPHVLAEIDRLVSHDPAAPFEPVSATAHVAAAEPAPITGVVPAGATL